MPRLFHPKHEAFCNAYVRGPTAGNYTASYEAAGFVRNEGNASRFAAQPHIQDRVAELAAENNAVDRQATDIAIRAAALDKYSLLAELRKVGFSNMLDYLHIDDDDRLQVDLSRLDRDKGTAIRDIKINYDDETRRVKSVSLKLFDKRPALAELGRRMGTAPIATQESIPPLDPSSEALQAEFAKMSNAQIEDWLLAYLAPLAKMDVDLRDFVERAIERGAIELSRNAKPLREMETLEEAIARNKAWMAEAACGKKENFDCHSLSDPCHLEGNNADSADN